MRSLRSEFATATLVFLFCVPVYAENLTWEDCVRLASQNNPAVRAAEDNLRAAQAQVGVDRSGFFPTLSAATGYTYANSATVSSGSVVGGSASSSTYIASLSASQNIFNGLADRAKVQEGKATQGINEAALATAKAQVSYNLKSAFVGLDVAQKSIDLARQISIRREQNLRMVELRFKDGQENKGNVLLYQAYLKDAHFGELQSDDSRIAAQAQLAQALGMDDFQSLSISGEVPVHEPPGANSTQPESLAVRAPAYVQAVYQLNYDEAAVTVARAAFFPTLVVNGSTQKAGPWFPQADTWQLSATLNIPIFNGGRDFYATRAALATRSSAEHTRSDVAHSTASTITNGYVGYIESVQKLEVDRAYLDAASVRADIARANYRNGITSFQDWDLAESDLIAREKNILQDLQSRVVAEATWEQSQGKGAIP